MADQHHDLLAFILPISLRLSPEWGLSVIPTFTAMTLLAIPPILVSTYAGLRGVDPEVVEAARGLGLSERHGPVSEIPTTGDLPISRAHLGP